MEITDAEWIPACGSFFFSAAVADGAMDVATDVEMDAEITTDVDAAANFSSAENSET